MNSYRYLSLILLLSTALVSAKTRKKHDRAHRQQDKAASSKVEESAPLENTNTDSFQVGNATQETETVESTAPSEPIDVPATSEKIEPVKLAAEDAQDAEEGEVEDDSDLLDECHLCNDEIEANNFDEYSEEDKAAYLAFQKDLENELRVKVLEIIDRHPRAKTLLEEPDSRIEYTFLPSTDTDEVKAA